MSEGLSFNSVEELDIPSDELGFSDVESEESSVEKQEALAIIEAGQELAALEDLTLILAISGPDAAEEIFNSSRQN